MFLLRTVKLKIRVALEDGPELGSKLKARVAAGPVREAGGRAQSLIWLQQNARELFQARAPLRAPVGKIQVCRGADITVVAHVPGYLVGMAVASREDLEGQAPEVSIELRKAPRVRLRVLGPDGEPIKRALVQHVSTREYSDGSFNRWVAQLVSRASGVGFGASDNPRTGLARIHRIEQVKTDLKGMAELKPISIEPTRFIRIVSAGLQPHVSPLGASPQPEDLEVRLEPRVQGPNSYRLSYNGDLVTKGTLIVAQEIGGWKIAQSPIVCQRDASFPAKAIVPSLDYFVILEGSNVGDVLMGTIRFGTGQEVDISGLTTE